MHACTAVVSERERVRERERESTEGSAKTVDASPKLYTSIDIFEITYIGIQLSACFHVSIPQASLYVGT